MRPIRAARAGSVLDLQEPARIRKLQEAALKETRLGIPVLFALDVLHGYETIFPIPLGEAAAMDPALWEATARAAAAEAAAAGIALTFAPMLDVARDPRWGRMAESPGEDPWLGARFAAAKIRGFQGAGLSGPSAIAATAKHFAAYGAVTAGREYASVDVSSRTLHEVHLPPFAEAVREGVAAVIAGLPRSRRHTDDRSPRLAAGSLAGALWLRRRHCQRFSRHPRADLARRGGGHRRSRSTRVTGRGRYRYGEQRLSRRAAPGAEPRACLEADIDAAVWRVLTLKARLGLFSEPFAREAASPKEMQEKHRMLALEAARKSIVLLQNRGGLLPLTKPAKLAVAGPLSNAAGEMLGPWHAAGRPAIPLVFCKGFVKRSPIGKFTPSKILTALKPRLPPAKPMRFSYALEKQPRFPVRPRAGPTPACLRAKAGFCRKRRTSENPSPLP